MKGRDRSALYFFLYVCVLCMSVYMEGDWLGVLLDLKHLLRYYQGNQHPGIFFFHERKKAVYLTVCMSVYISAEVFCCVCVYGSRCSCNVPSSVLLPGALHKCKLHVWVREPTVHDKVYAGEKKLKVFSRCPSGLPQTYIPCGLSVPTVG